MQAHIGEIILGILGTSLFTLLWKRLDKLDTDILDVRNQVRHFVDLHINHEGRLATVEERTKK